MSNIITPDEVKILLNVSGSSYDDRIELLIPIVTSHIEEYCQDKFYSGSLSAGYSESSFSEVYPYYTNVVQKYPEGLKLVAVEMIRYQLYKQNNISVSSETIGAYSVTYNTNSYPQEILDLLKPYRKIGFK